MFLIGIDSDGDRDQCSCFSFRFEMFGVLFLIQLLRYLFLYHTESIFRLIVLNILHHRDLGFNNSVTNNFDPPEWNEFSCLLVTGVIGGLRSRIIAFSIFSISLNDSGKYSRIGSFNFLMSEF